MKAIMFLVLVFAGLFLSFRGGQWESKGFPVEPTITAEFEDEGCDSDADCCAKHPELDPEFCFGKGE